MKKIKELIKKNCKVVISHFFTSFFMLITITCFFAKKIFDLLSENQPFIVLICLVCICLIIDIVITYLVRKYQESKKNTYIKKIFSHKEIEKYFNLNKVSTKKETLPNHIVLKEEIYEQFIKDNIHPMKPELLYPILTTLIVLTFSIPPSGEENYIEILSKSSYISMFMYVLSIIIKMRDFWEEELINNQLRKINNIYMNNNK